MLRLYIDTPGMYVGGDGESFGEVLWRPMLRALDEIMPPEKFGYGDFREKYKRLYGHYPEEVGSAQEGTSIQETEASAVETEEERSS
jgi:hypothetical protein